MWTRVVAVAFVVGTPVACDSSSTVPPAPFAARTVDAGDVTVTVVPTVVNSVGATISVVLDTHSIDLSMDLAASASLTVGDAAWTNAGWTGDAPGGHHRAGEIRFTATGPAAGPVIFTISGLSKPVEATWVLGGG